MTKHPRWYYWRPVRKLFNLLFGTVMLLAVATPVAGQSRTAVGVFSAAATSDWVSTYSFLSQPALGMHEVNPVLKPFKNRPVPTVLAGAAIDVGGLWLWNRYVGRCHPRLATLGLYSASVFRAWLATRNAHLIQTAKRS
jgi:hypothetical protein